MRATMRITWLLLSLSFLFHSVCSEDSSTTSVTKSTAVVINPPLIMLGGNISGPTTESKPTAGTNATQPTHANQTTAVPTLAITVTAAAKTSSNPAPTQPNATTVTNNPPASPTSISSASSTVVTYDMPAATNTSTLKTMTQTTIADSNGSSVVSTNAATIQTPKASVPSTGTVEPLNSGNVGTTKITKVTTDVPMQVQQPKTHTTITPQTTQVHSKGSTKEMTVTVTSHEQTASRAPEPVGNPGTTSTPSSLTKAGPPAPETFGSKAETTAPQTKTTATTAAQPKTFLYSLNNGHKKDEEKDLVEVCMRLMTNLQDGNCTLTWQHTNGKTQFDYVEINGKVKTSLASQYYEEITKKPTDNKTLIAILASCGALLIMIVILAVCASHHRKPYNENQQHLTEELHTVENGYHDNPTLEVMEVQPEMQEKKMALNGEFNNDSWIVPIDNLLKEDILEEDTHL